MIERKIIKVNIAVGAVIRRRSPWEAIFKLRSWEGLASPPTLIALICQVVTVLIV